MLRWALGIIAGASLFAPSVRGETMSSENFRVFSDVVSTGGVYSTSSNYRLHDVVGEQGTSPPTSTSALFAAHSGFLPQGAQILTLTVSATSIDLGRLSSGAVATAALTATISTNSVTGFSASIREDHDLQTSGGHTLSDVGDGAVTAGSLEYGFRTQGTYGLFNASDTGINAAGTTFAQSSGAVSGAQTTITFRAAISGVTPGGDYDHNVTVRASANF